MGEATTRCKWSSATTAICHHEATVAPRRSAGDRRQWWQQSTAHYRRCSCVLSAGDEISRPAIYGGGRCFCKWSSGYDREATTALITLHLVTCKKEAHRSDGNISEVFTKDTPILKLVMVLVSKRRDRALARKNYPYLNRWADPLFIDVLRGLRCSSDPIGLDSECSRRIDMLQDISDGTGTVTGDMSGVRWRIVSVVPGHYCQHVWGGVTQTMRGPLSGWCLSVV
ncbi:hypothetical protein TIFTF001_034876 [Ficus carica]|uniref:Uncharacterized protein n=1 Tax=Ficus carica TaxID=3494 RepID=A0AA88E0M9_FICCA|nr:hypothetical protein TIFTF001_034818 [Ficus carica]GMN65769.1 hypothetical protein TIFTF001_034843 [Ficus carica]GMN65796.1 hypothetical protein TIFTF001_034853 [Ficus carica]GMN65803.1 hypothetical protein TIFTF001_034876 [Ficus carica]